ncbi:UNVERIFIED_CONTAM: integrase [Paenibacillus sp. PvR008]
MIMANEIYNDEFYNEEQKLRFLQDFTQNTYGVFSRVLKRAGRMEKNYSKDLYNFNLAEIEELLNYLSPKTVQASITNGATIEGYIRWAISQDLRDNKLNPLSPVSDTEYYKSFVDKTNKLIFSEDEINKIVYGLPSRQDAVIVQAIFEGIMGRDNSELLNLKISDLDAINKTILLKNINKYGTEELRKVTITEQLVRIIQEANEETVYKSILSAGGRDKKLVPSSYVIKGAGKAYKDDGQTSAHTIRQRIKVIGLMEGYNYLNPINIRNSGMLKMAKDIYKTSKKLQRDEIEAICRHFNVGLAKDGVNIMSTIYTREFLNLETLLNKYPNLE